MCSKRENISAEKVSGLLPWEGSFNTSSNHLQAGWNKRAQVNKTARQLSPMRDNKGFRGRRDFRQGDLWAVGDNFRPPLLRIRFLFASIPELQFMLCSSWRACVNSKGGSGNPVMCCDKRWELLPSNYYRLPNRAKMREIYLCHSCAPHKLCRIVRAETWFCKWKRCNSDFVAKNAFRSSLSSSHCDSQANVWNTKNLLNINVIESIWTWLTVHRW